MFVREERVGPALDEERDLRARRMLAFGERALGDRVAGGDHRIAAQRTQRRGLRRLGRGLGSGQQFGGLCGVQRGGRAAQELCGDPGLRPTAGAAVKLGEELPDRDVADSGAQQHPEVIEVEPVWRRAAGEGGLARLPRQFDGILRPGQMLLDERCIAGDRGQGQPLLGSIVLAADDAAGAVDLGRPVPPGGCRSR